MKNRSEHRYSPWKCPLAVMSYKKIEAQTTEDVAPVAPTGSGRAGIGVPGSWALEGSQPARRTVGKC